MKFKNKILKQSQLLGLKTFGWEVKLKLYSINYPILKPLAYLIGKLNTFQMNLDILIRHKT